MTANPEVTVHLENPEEKGVALCGNDPKNGEGLDVLVDTLDDDPMVDCPVCRDLETGEDEDYADEEAGEEWDDPFDHMPEDE